MTQLQKLQPAKLVLSSRVVRKDGDEIAHVRVSNPGRSIAFFIHLQVKQGRGEAGCSASHLAGQLFLVVTG